MQRNIDTIKCTNICLMAKPEGEEKDKGAGKLFKK